MNEKAVKRRDWIKNIAIIFLAVLLLLTLFSNTILNYSLPEVAVQTATYATITTRVRANGTVEANSVFDVSVPEARYVESIAVKVGAEVKKGDLLFTLEETESAALSDARMTLKELESAYEKAKLASGTDLSSYEDALTDAKKALADAQAIYDGLTGNDQTLRRLKDELKSQEKRIELIEEELAEANKILGSVSFTDGLLGSEDQALHYLAMTENTLNMHKSSVKGIEQQLTFAKNETARAQSAYDAMLAEQKRYEELAGLLSAYESKQLELDRYLFDFDVYIAKMTDEVKGKYNAYASALDSYREALKGQDAAAIAAAKNEYTSAKLALYVADAGVQSYIQGVEEKEAAIEGARALYENTRLAYGKQYELDSTIREKANSLAVSIVSAKDAVDAATRGQKTIEDSLSFANEQLNLAQKAYDEAKTVADKFEGNAEYTKARQEKFELEAELEIEQEALAELKDRIEKTESKVIDNEDAKKAVTDAERAVEKAEKDLETQKKQAAIDGIDRTNAIEKAKLAVDKQKAEVERLEKNVIEKEVTSKVNGTVKSIALTPGKEAAANTTLMQIELSDMGYTVTCSITNEQSRLVKAGDYASLLYYYGDNPPVLRVASVKNDPSDPTKKKQVVLEVESGGVSGARLNFTLGERNQSYEAVIPNNAVREDNNGKFVLVVSAKNTPLGNRYTAKRVDVEVLASDEKQSAVSGISAYNEYVITTVSGTAIVTDGTQVRMAE